MHNPYIIDLLPKKEAEMSMRNVFRVVVFLLAVCMISAITGCGGGGDGNGGNNPGSVSGLKQ
jgi:hypothetical protein